jgi:DNA-binding response OmpR family regulator
MLSMGKDILYVAAYGPAGIALKLYAAEKGYALTQASNAKDAYRAVQEKNFDIILIDFDLPVLSGDLLGEQLRMIHRDARIYGFNSSDIKIEQDRKKAFTRIIPGGPSLDKIKKIF